MQGILSRKRKLIKDILIYGLGMVSVKIFSFLFIPFLTRYIEPEKFAQFDLINNFILLLIPILSFQVSEGAYRFILNVKSEEEKNKYICNTFIIVGKGIILSFAALIIIYMTNYNNKIPYLMYSYIWLLMATINGVLAQIIRGLEKTVIFSVNSVIFSVSTILLNIIFVIVLKMNIEGLILANLLGFVISNVYFIFSSRLNINIIKNMDRTVEKDLLKYSVPLIFSTISWWVMNVSDRYIAASYVGMKELGIYSIANRFSAMLSFIYTVFYMGWQTSSIEAYNSEDREEFYSKIFNLLALTMFVIVIMSILFIKPFISVFVSQEYYRAFRYIPLLLLAMVFNSFSSFYGVGYLAVKNTKGATYTSFISCIVNIIINLIFMRKYGIPVAVISTFIAFFAMWVIRVITMKDYFKVNIKSYNVVLFIFTLYSFYFLFRG